VSLIDLFLDFLKAATFSVGGLSALPLLRAELVSGGVVSEREVLEAIAIGRLSPGPGGLYLVSLGYFAAGVPGAVIAMTASTIPPLTFVVLTGFVRKQLMSPLAAGAIRGVALSTSALVIATGIQLLSPAAPIWNIPAWQTVLAVIAVLLSIEGRIHPGILIAGGALVGLVLAR